MPNIHRSHGLRWNDAIIHRNEKRHAEACLLIVVNYRLAAIAVIAASQSVARAIAVAARGVVATAILATEAAFLAARLGLTAKSRRTALTAKTLAATNSRSMALGAVCLTVPLTVTFLASGMTVSAVRRAVVESCAASLS